MYLLNLKIDLQDYIYNLRILCAKFGESSLALEKKMQMSRVSKTTMVTVCAKLALPRTGNTVMI